MAPSNKSSKPIQPPKGTRDLYPDDVLKRRYIQNAWRDASLRCGFDEIEGPTFETSDLYSIKSGEGILNELFQVFSGKGGQETLDKLLENGKADFALRPEFTPTLARMYAARAKQLTKPCKWFTIGPYFRAERPQKGRLREFLQLNCDIIGLPSDDDTPTARAQMDAETIEVCVNVFAALGLDQSNLSIQLNDRTVMAAHFQTLGLSESQTDTAFTLLDKRDKLPLDKLADLARDESLPEPFITFLTRPLTGDPSLEPSADQLSDINSATESYADWISTNFNIARGLAYYTGTVFEAIADGHRALVGGGRYDNLIELMGGPPTPAVGFGMGDVTLFNTLDEKQLIPEGPNLMEAVSRKQASIRPQAFIAVPNNDEENKAAAQSLAATLRRGTESETYLSRDDRKPWQSDRYAIRPLHTRTSYKSTTNPGKLRKDADAQHAKYFIEVHAPNKVALTDMDKREPITHPTHESFSANPTDNNYIGTTLAELV